MRIYYNEILWNKDGVKVILYVAPPVSKQLIDKAKHKLRNTLDVVKFETIVMKPNKTYNLSGMEFLDIE